MINENSTKPKAKAAKIPLQNLHPFKNHPYKVEDNEEMVVLVESIKENGIFSPLIVRPIDEGEYEVISGHRRLFAAKKAGLLEVPALIYAIDKDAAIITLVDSNLHREHILPSEKAFAYKMKMDALSHQGKTTSTQVALKLETADLIGENENVSGDTVRRYIRLTNLIPEILKMVDENKIAFTSATTLSYLNKQEQLELSETMDSEDCTPSLSQAIQLKKLSEDGQLNIDVIFDILTKEKANQKEKLKIPVERVRNFFPKDYTTSQMEDTIVKLCEDRYRQKMCDRDAR